MLESVVKKSAYSPASVKYDQLNENLASGLNPSEDLGIAFEENEEQA